ncbi:flavodoxin family protein [Nocardia takedensis]|uniref:flavodoxin family protein n=1 Tax=Nocardia takedensis TaxID=259390 RepID=UPI0007C42FDF|nr:NAD(P)H-dependent oxidoreductase [Nocardia takedensis]
MVFHSRSGNVHRLAVAAAERATELGAEVRLRKLAELPDTMVLDGQAYQELAEATAEVPVVTWEDLIWADAIMIGTPVHFGLPAPELLHFLDHAGPVAIPGKLANKAVTVFASGSASHAGQQTAILAVHNAVCHWGSLIVPNGSNTALQASDHNGSPYGTCSISRHKPANVHPENIEAIRYQTLRVFEVARAYGIGLAQTESAIEFVELEWVSKQFDMDGIPPAWTEQAPTA